MVREGFPGTSVYVPIIVAALVGRDPVLFCDGCYAVVSELQQDMVASKVAQTNLFAIIIIIISIIITIIITIIIVTIIGMTWYPVR